MARLPASALSTRWPLAAVLATCLGTALAGGAARDWLAWDRQRLLAGELWRLVTGHLVHAGWTHTLESAFGCAALLLWPAATTRSARSWSCAIVLLALAISTTLFLRVWPPVYYGLSGILHGLFALVLVTDCGAPWTRALLLAALWGKVVFEQMVGPLPGTSTWIGVPVAVDAHLAGTAAGTLLGFGERAHTALRHQSRRSIWARSRR